MSVRINLLPYREAKRAEARRQMGVMAGGVAALGVVLVLLAHMVMSGYISSQETRNNFLVSENAALDKKIEEIKRLQGEIEALKARKSVIETLQFDRAAAVHARRGAVLAGARPRRLAHLGGLPRAGDHSGRQRRRIRPATRLTRRSRSQL